MQRILAVTTIREGSADNPIERVRAQVFLDTARTLAEHDIACMAIHTGCSEQYIAQVRKLGIVLQEQEKPGMGSARRQALRSALGTADYCVWLEPEKPDIVRFFRKVAALMQKAGTRLGLFNRLSLKSYPEEQACYYHFCRIVASRLTGFDVDYAFGPMMIAQDALSDFLDYDGRYGDLWDSILIPRLKFIRIGDVVTLRAGFRNDPRMTQIETARIEMTLRRVEQLSHTVPSLVSEWSRLA